MSLVVVVVVWSGRRTRVARWNGKRREARTTTERTKEPPLGERIGGGVDRRSFSFVTLFMMVVVLVVVVVVVVVVG